MDGAAETREVDGETRNSGGLVSPRACLDRPARAAVPGCTR